MHIPREIMLELLKIPRGLKKLEYSIPGLELDDDPSYTPNYRFPFTKPKIMSEPLSVIKVPASLMATRETLEELSIHDINTRWHGHDESVQFRRVSGAQEIANSIQLFFQNILHRIESIEASSSCTRGFEGMSKSTNSTLCIIF